MTRMNALLSCRSSSVCTKTLQYKADKSFVTVEAHVSIKLRKNQMRTTQELLAHATAAASKADRNLVSADQLLLSLIALRGRRGYAILATHVADLAALQRDLETTLTAGTGAAARAQLDPSVLHQPGRTSTSGQHSPSSHFCRSPLYSSTCCQFHPLMASASSPH